MANLHRSARGTVVDIAKLKLANEETVVVGNMGVNARGDKIGHGKKVIESRNQIMDKVYAVPSAEPISVAGGYSPNDPAAVAGRRLITEANNAKELSAIVNNLNIETNQAVDAPATPAPRGSLADSIAKSASVVQEPIENPNNPKLSGPSRI
jgi:hypothetical protein